MTGFAKNKPFDRGISRMTHAEKMALKKADREKLSKLPRSFASQSRVADRVEGMRQQNARNGVGRPPLFKRFLVSREVI